MAILQSKRTRVNDTAGYGKTPISVVNPDSSLLSRPVNDVYDNAEFTLANGQTDYDVKVGESDAFNNIETATLIEIRTDKTITVKFNSTSNDSYTITSSDSPAVFDTLEVTNIFISNASGNTANIKVFLT